MSIFMLKTTVERESYSGDWKEEVVHTDLGYWETEVEAQAAADAMNAPLVAADQANAAEYERQREVYKQDEERAAKSGFRTLLSHPSRPMPHDLFEVTVIERALKVDPEPSLRDDSLIPVFLNGKVPGSNVDRIDVSAGVKFAATLGYDDTGTRMVVEYALQRWGRGEEQGAIQTALSGGVDLTSLYMIVAAANTAVEAQEKEQSDG